MSEIYKGNNISIENLSYSKAEIKIFGNTKQETREGYNLLKIAIVPQTIDGITFKINEDNSILANGTASADVVLLLQDETSYLAGDYFLSDGVKGSSATYFTRIYSGSSGYETVAQTINDNTKKFKLTEDTILRTFLIIKNGTILNNVIFKPMIVKGLEEKPYEPYGVMPSLEFPSTIRNVGDDVNLFDENSEWNVNASVGGSGDLKQFPISTGGNKRTYFFKVEPNTDYSVFCEEKGDRLIICELNSIVNPLDYSANNLLTADRMIYNSSVVNKYNFKTSNNAKMVFIYYAYEIIPTKFKIAKGKEIGYSQFGQGSVEISVCNENLFNKDTVTIGFLLPNTGAVDNYSGDMYTSDFIKIDSTQKYYISPRDSIRGKYFDENKNLLYPAKNNSTGYDDFGASSNGEVVLNNIPNNAKYIRFSLKTEHLDSCYIIVGDKPTDYVEHESQEVSLPIQKEMLKIGDVEDTFIKQNGKWYEKHYINKYNFTGDENWSVSSTNTSGENRFYMILPKEANDNARNINCISNKFKGIAEPEMYQQTEGVACTSQRCYIFINDKKTLAANEFKTYINGIEDMYVYYVLLEPELIPCTAEQENILEQLYNIELYKGINNIIVKSSIEPNLEVKVIKAIEDYEVYISKDGYLHIPELNIKYLVNLSESNIPTMPEAVESSVRASGRDGDIILNTTYEPLSFNIVCYTEDNLTVLQKVEEEEKINKFLNSIKNKTIAFATEKGNKFYNVKYNGVLTTVNYPKHLKFSIPLKSSESYGRGLIKKIMVGNAIGKSETAKEVGALFIIRGPAINPIISLNDYSMEYNMNILEGARVEIDTNKSTITNINSDGVKTNVMKYYNHQFPKIEYGENTLKVLSGLNNNMNVNVVWNDLKL